MKKKEIMGVICLFAFGITIINALTLVAFGFSEVSMDNTNTSGHEKAFDPGSMNLSVKPGETSMNMLMELGLKVTLCLRTNPDTESSR